MVFAMLEAKNFENPACPLCNCSDKISVYKKRNKHHVVRCSSCSFYYLSPRLREDVMLERYKDNSYFSDETLGYNNYSGQEQSLLATFHRFMANLSKNSITGGSLLEVGCGYGFLLEEAKSFFKVRVGSEFSPLAANIARSKADQVYEGGLEQVPSSKKFDCIITNHVIEHVYQPKLFVEQLIKHLNPGAKLVISTPDMGSLWRRIMGNNWPSFKIPEHILYFDKMSLSTLMRESGLVDIKSIPYPHAFPLHLVANKLNLSLPQSLGKHTLWFPATTIAMCGTSPHA